MNKYAILDPRRSKSGLRGGEPLKTFVEMAEEFKLHPQALKGEMRDSKIPYPKPVQKYRSTPGGEPNRTYYKPSEMRRWWKQHQETKQCQKSTSGS